MSCGGLVGAGLGLPPVLPRLLSSLLLELRPPLEDDESLLPLSFLYKNDNERLMAEDCDLVTTIPSDRGGVLYKKEMKNL